MKAVVVEIKNGLAAVLSDDGCIIKLQNNNYSIGQVMELKERTAFNTKKAFSLATAAAAAVIVFTVSAWAYYTPYSYVSLDVNPSIGYSVNMLSLVVDAKAVNGDGDEILKNLNLKNKSIKDAVNETVHVIADNGYFDGNSPGGIMITTSSKSTQKGEQLADALEKSVKEETAGLPSVRLEVQNIALESVQVARELGISPGKLSLIEKLQQSAVGISSIDINNWINKPVKDIMKATKEFKEITKAAEKAANKNFTPNEKAEINEFKASEAAEKAEKARTRNSKATENSSSSVSSGATNSSSVNSSSSVNENSGKNELASQKANNANNSLSASSDSSVDKSNNGNNDNAGSSNASDDKSNNGNNDIADTSSASDDKSNNGNNDKADTSSASDDKSNNGNNDKADNSNASDDKSNNGNDKK